MHEPEYAQDGLGAAQDYEQDYEQDNMHTEHAYDAGTLQHASLAPHPTFAENLQPLDPLSEGDDRGMDPQQQAMPEDYTCEEQYEQEGSYSQLVRTLAHILPCHLLKILFAGSCKIPTKCMQGHNADMHEYVRAADDLEAPGGHDYVPADDMHDIHAPEEQEHFVDEYGEPINMHGDLAHARTHETFFNEQDDVTNSSMHEDQGDRSSHSIKHVGVGQVRGHALSPVEATPLFFAVQAQESVLHLQLLELQQCVLL